MIDLSGEVTLVDSHVVVKRVSYGVSDAPHSTSEQAYKAKGVWWWWRAGLIIRCWRRLSVQCPCGFGQIHRHWFLQAWLLISLQHWTMPGSNWILYKKENKPTPVTWLIWSDWSSKKYRYRPKVCRKPERCPGQLGRLVVRPCLNCSEPTPATQKVRYQNN